MSANVFYMGGIPFVSDDKGYLSHLAGGDIFLYRDDGIYAYIHFPAGDFDVCYTEAKGWYLLPANVKNPKAVFETWQDAAACILLNFTRRLK